MPADGDPWQGWLSCEYGGAALSSICISFIRGYKSRFIIEQLRTRHVMSKSWRYTEQAGIAAYIRGQVGQAIFSEGTWHLSQVCLGHAGGLREAAKARETRMWVLRGEGSRPATVRRAETDGPKRGNSETREKVRWPDRTTVDARSMESNYPRYVSCHGPWRG